MRRRSHPPSTCRDVIDLLTQYMEGGLPAATRRALADHLAGCAACGGYLASIERTRGAVRRLACAELPREVHDRLRAFVDRQGRRT